MTILSSVTGMTAKVRNKKQQINEVYVNDTKIHCDANILDYFDGKETNENCHDSSNAESDKTVQLQE